MNWWTAFWTWANENQLAATVIGGMILAAVLWLVARLPKVGPHVRSALKWPFTLRVTTSKRLRHQRLELSSRDRRIADLRKDVEEVRLAGSNNVEAVRSLGEKQAREQQLAHEEAREAARMEGFESGRAAALAEVEAERARPLVKPVWRVEVVAPDEVYALVNAQRGSFAGDVAIEAHHQEFTFTSGTQWSGEFGHTQVFKGTRLTIGRRQGVKFVIRYSDERGDRQEAHASIDRDTLRAVVL